MEEKIAELTILRNKVNTLVNALTSSNAADRDDSNYIYCLGRLDMLDDVLKMLKE